MKISYGEITVIPIEWSTLIGVESVRKAVEILTEVNRIQNTGVTVLPPFQQIFRSLQDLNPSQVRVIIIGQDPYHGINEANGYAFAVNESISTPPSLQNIFKEVESDLKRPPLSDRTLLSWVSQGVLLLNSTLTVEKDTPNSHYSLEWYKVTDSIIKALSDNFIHNVYILWGNFAKNKKYLINLSNNLIIESAHPSPLSAHRGFLGSKPFSKANNYLLRHNRGEILW
jgi:uracil-DNA glycosylase